MYVRLNRRTEFCQIHGLPFESMAEDSISKARIVLDETVLHVRFSARYSFQKPNDKRALDLMNQAAVAVMKDLADIVIAYGVSDEFR